MKKFLITALCLLLAAAGSYYAFFYRGFYLNFGREGQVALPFRAQGTALERYDGEQYLPLTLRGVDVSGSLPGHFATAYAPAEEDYLRWFEAIGEMGANAVRAVTVMDDDFYNALFAYNTTHAQPLYLLQGTSVPDDAGDGPKDAYDDGFRGSLIRSGRTLVDVVHGRKNIVYSRLEGSGSYRRDVSPWVVGFLVGTEWYPDTIAYTDHSVIRSAGHAGVYFETAQGATAFETMLAQVMEEITAYETEKYGQQRPIGFISDPACDFLDYGEVYARQLQKYARLNPEHVRPTGAMAAGRFAAYRLYDFCPDFSQYLSVGQRAALAPIIDGMNTDEVYGGYLELLARYHTMPVVAAGYGFSSARGAVKLDHAPLTEQEQGERLAAVSRTLEKDGWAGGFVSTWQDVWERRTWNTAFAAESAQGHLWHDLQTDGQGYGLMAFAPGREPVCVLDGNPSEWTERDLVLERDGLRLSARYDAEGLYLLAEGIDPAGQTYLPIDLSPQVGSRSSGEPALEFEREADFLLWLNGAAGSRLLVQQRYDAMRENFLYEVEGDDPFLSVPGRDTPEFVPIRMALENDLLLDDVTPEARILQRLGTWETGRLTHGSGDPASPEYNSLADFRFGEGCVEIRLPWLLLNIGDPSRMAAHQDYYRHYGVELQRVRSIYLGAARQGDAGEISMHPFRVKGWGPRVEYRERLKQSYYRLQALWKGGRENASDH